jgi:hypothetical protein
MANRAINTRIQQMLNAQSAAADRMLPRGRIEGVLAVIRIEQNQYPDGQVQYSNPFMYRPLILGQSPGNAVTNWLAQPRLEAAPRGPTATYIRRYFWANRFIT